MKTVSSRDNAAFKAVARLVSSTSARRASGTSVLDGAHLLAAFLEAGHKPEAVMVSRAGHADPEVARLVERCGPAPATLLSDALFASLSTVDSPTGVIAVVRTPPGAPVADDAPFVLALEDIQDPGNVGTLLRSAAAAGARDVLLSRRCAFAWSPKVLRAAMGAHFALNIVEGADLADFLARYRGMSVALAGEAERSLYEVDLRGSVALVVGNEGAGLTAPLLASARVRARIPMAGPVESLNAGTAGSIALFEALRQRRERGRAAR
ncbi:MAG TPA: RNA methyltransferase [Usitatibacter sp.]|nr:RNA methyltransferase [Usitatibacter sp.]